MAGYFSYFGFWLGGFGVVPVVVTPSFELSAVVYPGRNLTGVVYPGRNLTGRVV